MSENLPGGPMVSRALGVAVDGTRYGIMLARLAAAGLALRGVGERVRETYRYVEDCARSVEYLADLAAQLGVDTTTLVEHRDAAAMMRHALGRARAMAEACDEMSVMFEQAKAAHQADYGSVAEAARAMPVPMANRAFYRTN